MEQKCGNKPHGFYIYADNTINVACDVVLSDLLRKAMLSTLRFFLILVGGVQDFSLGGGVPAPQ